MLETLVDDLKQTHGDDLISVVLYGSAATGEHQEGQSDYNVLVVLRQITPDDLQSARPIAERWRDAGNPLPIYFTEEEMTRASDVFPIEFLDMSRAHRVLNGPDPFEELVISRDNLRHQLEYELRGKLIRLRELYIPTSQNGERLSALMVDSLNSFVVLFRHVIGLFGEAVPASKEKTINRLGEKLGLDVTPFLKVLALGQQEKALSLDQATEYFTYYLKAIEATVRRVDELGDAGHIPA